MAITGEMIRSKRTEMRLSQEALGKAVGVSKGTISAVESNKSNACSANTFSDICIFLGLAVNGHDGSDSSSVPIETRLARLKTEVAGASLSLDSLIEDAKTLLADSEEDSISPFITAEVNLLLSELYYKKGRYSEVVGHASVAQEMFSQSGDTLRWANATYFLAVADQSIYNFEGALVRLRGIESKLTGKRSGEYLLTKTYLAIAFVGSAIRDSDIMSEYTKKGLDGIGSLPTATEKQRAYAATQYISGCSLFQEGAYMDAIDQYNLSLILYKAIHDRGNAAIMLHNIAEAYIESGEFDAAEGILEETSKLKSDAQLPEIRQSKTKILYARIQLKKGDFGATIGLCREVLKSDALDISDQMEAYRLIAKAHLGNGDKRLFSAEMKKAISIARTSTVYRHEYYSLLDEYVQVIDI